MNELAILTIGHEDILLYSFEYSRVLRVEHAFGEAVKLYQFNYLHSITLEFTSCDENARYFIITLKHVL
jgi:hypothetical protein